MNIHKNIMKEITPLTSNDCFTIFSRVKNGFNFPLHYHDEYELNFILNAKGAQRIVGDNIEVIGDLELVLVGPNLPHVWLTNECTTEITEITIQWHNDLFDDKFLKRNQMNLIRKMMEKSLKGISFTRETINSVMPRLLKLKDTNGFNSVLELLGIFHDLSVSKSMVLLSDSSLLSPARHKFNSRRLEKAFELMNNNYHKEISLKDLSKLTNMTEESFSRFIKKRTGNTFINSLNEIRLGHASRMLIDTTHSITEICYLCGFNNVSNFNRIFKKKKHCTPKEFRENFSGHRIFI